MKKFTDFFLAGRMRDLALAELGYTLHISDPFIPISQIAVPATLRPLLDTLRKAYDLGNEQAKREAIVGPILGMAATAVGAARIQTETPVYTEAVGGTVDYWITGHHTVLVVKAKDSDIERGLGQLAAELIATIAQPDVVPPAYGIVTSGELWRFATVDETTKTIMAERVIYAVPLQLDEVFQRVCAMLHGKANAS